MATDRFIRLLPLVGLLAAGMVHAADMASPPNSLVVDEIGNIGIGTANPTQTGLHINAEDFPGLRMEDTNTSNNWTLVHNGGGASLIHQYNGVGKSRLGATGNLTIEGFLSENSDRSAKERITRLDVGAVLDKVLAMPITEWSYKKDAAVRHIGPMAQDFHAAFGVGATDTKIATLDTSGVALAAIQGLNERLQKKNSEIAQLQQELAELRAMVQTLTAKGQMVSLR